MCACSLYFAVELNVNSIVQTVLSSLLLLLVVLIVVGTCVVGLWLQRVKRSQMVYPSTMAHDSEGGVSVAPPPSMISMQSLIVVSSFKPSFE